MNNREEKLATDAARQIDKSIESPPATPPPPAGQTADEVAHAELVRAFIPAAARRMQILIRSAVETCGAGDYAIWLPISAMDSALKDLKFTHDKDGLELPRAAVLENDAKIHILAAVALRSYSSRLLEHAHSAIQAARGESGAEIFDVDWDQTDSEAAYEEALQIFNDMTGRTT
jgi:hypothetical protein